MSDNPGRSGGGGSAGDEEFSPSPMAFRHGSASPTLTSSPGCGCVVPAVTEPEITISITPTTGGHFDLTVDRHETIENLKKIISKRLKVSKERICLLHRERQLREGTLEENRLQDGSRLTLLPSVETGLLAQRPEQSVMQALESLSDSQVNDFLSGKAPLNLTMRLGDHMMLIQLQLSTVTPASPVDRSSGPTTSASTSLSGSSPSATTSSSTEAITTSNHASNGLPNRRSTVLSARSTSSSTKLQNTSANTRTPSLISSLASASCNTSLLTATTTTNAVCSERTTSSPSSSTSSTTYSPVSSPHSIFCPQSSNIQQPRTNNAPMSPPPSVASTNSTSSRQSCILHHRHHHHTHHHHHLHHHHHMRKVLNLRSSASNSVELPPSTSISGCSDLSPSLREEDVSSPKKKLCTGHHHQQQQQSSATSSSSCTRSPGSAEACSPSSTDSGVGIVDVGKGTSATLDTRALAEASRNLTQKLKQLSSEENARLRQGAIIESMHHHGKGVYSGTFSGTLNPALQDRHGRPKRDISTIIHILNDLLCATPATSAGHYRHHHRYSSTRQISSSTSGSSTGSSATGNGMSSVSTSCPNSPNLGYSSEELSKENEATKGKLKRLRLVMEQRRAKRKARRQARAAPYTTQWAAVTPDPDPNHDPNTPTASSSTSGSKTTDSQTESDLQPCNTEPVVA